MAYRDRRAAQYTIALFIVLIYALAVVFITPLALTVSSGGRPVGDVGGLMLARGVDTLLGCVVALGVYLMITRRHNAAGLPEAVARTLDAVATTSHHLVLGAVTTGAGRTARRDLQIRAIAMLTAYDAGIGGTARRRRSAEQLWPAVATEQLAYRTLAACWATNTIGLNAESARAIGRSVIAPDGVERFIAPLNELATAIRSG